MNDVKRNVLILSAGRRVELVQEFKFSLHKFFPSACVFTTDLRPKYSAACQISDKAFSSPRVTSEEYISFLLSLCEQEGIGMLIPTIDTELLVLSKNRDLFENHGIHVIISASDLVEKCRDKRETHSVFNVLKIDQPTIYTKDNLQYPCFCKPYDGSCSIGAKAIFDSSMLTPEIISDEKNMFMELIGKEYNEFTIDAYYDRHGILCCLVPRERIEIRGGEISKGATRRGFIYSYLRHRLGNLVGARGCITIQCFYNPETQSVKALEINPRFGGGFPLSYSAGAHYPEWLIQEYFLDNDIDFYESWSDDLIMLRYDSQVIINE